ncbi:hypothetical protein Sjap_013766 [Stephania japonica]|uniref:Uncharacterized protein n=1 Tax=Stephania japonica TaxID=461633 RepID=A0AAP0NZC7_9MAGN
MDNWAWDTVGGDMGSCGPAWPPVADQCGNWGRHILVSELRFKESKLKSLGNGIGIIASFDMAIFGD